MKLKFWQVKDIVPQAQVRLSIQRTSMETTISKEIFICACESCDKLLESAKKTLNEEK